MRILLLVRYYMGVLPENDIQFNCSSQLKMSVLFRSTGFRYPETGWKSSVWAPPHETPIFCDTAKKVLVCNQCFMIRSERIQTVRRDIRIPKSHTNGIIRMKSLHLSPVSLAHHHRPLLLHHSVQSSLVLVLRCQISTMTPQANSTHKNHKHVDPPVWIHKHCVSSSEESAKPL